MTKAELEKALAEREAEATQLRTDLGQSREDVARLRQATTGADAAAELERLGAFIVEHYSHEIGDESAVDVAIRLLTPMEAVGQPVTVRGALVAHLAEQGFEQPEAEAATVITHLIDVARHSQRFGERTVRALMALETTSPE